MKKELFEKVVSEMTALFKMTSHATQEGFESYNFLVSETMNIEEVRRLKGNTREKVYGDVLIADYVSVTYKPESDKLSIGYFGAGWRWASKKKRYFPFQVKEPVMCMSKHIYAFNKYKTSRSPKPNLIKPVIMTTDHIFGIDIKVREAVKSALGIKQTPRVRTSAKYIINTKDDWEIIFNATGVRIPKALQIFKPDDVLRLVSVMKNPNELSTICQYIAGGEKNAFGYSDRVIMSGLSPVLINTLAMMMSLDNTWLLEDYIIDLQALGKKMSLSMTSRKRIEDEHRKMSAERILKGIKSVKVDAAYEGIADLLDIPTAELISNKRRLAEESAMQNHCVATYADKINRGDCCIVSMIHDNKRYTAEIMKLSTYDESGQGENFIKRKQIFRLNQLRGYRNEAPPRELELMLINKLNSISQPIEEVA